MGTADVVRLGGLSVLYIAAARLGLSLDAVGGFAAAVWPPTGLALAALLLYGYRLWPGITLGAFVVNLLAGAPVLVACGMALGNTLEALVGTALLVRLVGFRPSLARLQDVLGLVTLAAGLSTLLSATIGVSSGWLGGSIPAAMYGQAWLTWWLGDAVGALVVAPLWLVWSRDGRVALPHARLAEATGLLVAIGVLSLVMFDAALPTLPVPRYLVFPVLIWVALRLGPPGAATATALVSAVAIWGTARGVGPFVGPTLHDGLFMLQTFMSVMAVTMLVLAAAVAERRQAETTAHEQRELLQVTLSSIGDAVIATDHQGRVTFMNSVAATLTGWTEAEALGRDSQEVLRLINEHTREAVEHPVARVIREGTNVRLASHTLLLARDGSAPPIDDSAAPMRDASGRLRGVVLVFRDITTRQQGEAEAERQRRETSMLAELAQSLSASLDLDTVLQRVVTGAQELCSSERAVIMLREPDSDVLVGRYEVGTPHMAYRGLRIEPGQGLGGQVLRTGRPWRTPNYATDNRFSKEYLAGARAAGQLAVIAVPILIGMRVEGVFYVSNPATRPFTTQDEEILVRLATHAAMAIQNAQLYHAAQAEIAERRRIEAQLTASLQEKEVLIKEIHHRVKNNLQVISSLLNLQSDTLDDPRLLAQFQDSQNRIRSMALVHETLYQSQDLARLDIAPYIHTLSAQLFQSYGLDPQRIILQVKVEQLLLDIDRAIPCGLLLNELLTNAFKYAFPPDRAGVVQVEVCGVAPQQVMLRVRDTGIGLPASVDFRQTDTLGLQLVCMLTEQLNGTITLARDGGTSFTLTFPLTPPEH